MRDELIGAEGPISRDTKGSQYHSMILEDEDWAILDDLFGEKASPAGASEDGRSAQGTNHPIEAKSIEQRVCDSDSLEPAADKQQAPSDPPLHGTPSTGQRYLEHAIVLPTPYNCATVTLPLEEIESCPSLVVLMKMDSATTESFMEWSERTTIGELFEGRRPPHYPCLGRFAGDESLDGLPGTSISVLIRDTSPVEFDLALDLALSRFFGETDRLHETMDFLSRVVTSEIPRGIGAYPACILASAIPDMRETRVTVSEMVHQSSASIGRLCRLKVAFDRWTATYGASDSQCQSFSDLFFTAMRDGMPEASKNEARDIWLLKKRLGFDARELTLEQCGKALGVTRERARQLVSSALGGFDLAKSPRLVPIRLEIIRAAMELGMAGGISELTSLLEESNLWPETQRYEAAVRLSPDLETNKNVFQVRDMPCASCARCGDLLVRLARKGRRPYVKELTSELDCFRTCGFLPSGEAIARCNAFDSEFSKLVAPARRALGYKGPIDSGSRRSLPLARSIRMAFAKMQRPMTPSEIALVAFGDEMSDWDSSNILSHMLKHKGYYICLEGNLWTTKHLLHLKSQEASSQ